MQPETNPPQPAMPGWEYKPGGSPEPAQAPTPAPAPPTQQPEQPAQQPVPQTPQPRPSAKPFNGVQWTASEFIAHQKNTGWYGLLFLAAIAGSAAMYLLTRDVISTVMVVIVAVILGIFAARKPRTLDYQVDENGIHIGPKSYPYADFKSYAIIDEGAFNSITFIPMKRFMPAISVYYEPADEDQIINVLGNYLPVEERQKDAIDKFMHKIRF